MAIDPPPSCPPLADCLEGRDLSPGDAVRVDFKSAVFLPGAMSPRVERTIGWRAHPLHGSLADTFTVLHRELVGVVVEITPRPMAWVRVATLQGVMWFVPDRVRRLVP